MESANSNVEKTSEVVVQKPKVKIQDVKLKSGKKITIYDDNTWDEVGTVITSNYSPASTALSIKAPVKSTKSYKKRRSAASSSNYSYSGTCGARTKSGGSCRRRVKGGGYCWQHS